MHSICFSTDTGELKVMNKFRSLNILDTFTKGNLSVDIFVSRLHSGNDAYVDIVDYFDKRNDLVNSKDVCSVYGRGKRGIINEVSLLGNDIKEPGNNRVLSQDISTHVLHLHTPQKYYLDFSTIHGRSHDNIKFDFSTL